MENILITELLALSIAHETYKSLKIKQISKMKAGKVRKELQKEEHLRQRYGRCA